MLKINENYEKYYENCEKRPKVTKILQKYYKNIVKILKNM